MVQASLAGALIDVGTGALLARPPRGGENENLKGLWLDLDALQRAGIKGEQFCLHLVGRAEMAVGPLLLTSGSN
eukprot:8597614-Alexandrium_andersonii.AAC.1